MPDRNNQRKRQYFVSGAVVFNSKGEILLTQRHHPGSVEIHQKWQIPGGSVDFGEHPEAAAIREIKEETGLTIQINSPVPVITSYIFQTHPTHVILLTYKATYLSGRLVIPHTERETSDARWFSTEEYKKLSLIPQTETILEKIISSTY